MDKIILTAALLGRGISCYETSTICDPKIVDVYDGDTFYVDLKAGKKIVSKRLPIRVRGIDTPELRTKKLAEKKKALQAKKFTEKSLENSKIVLTNCARGKFFRLVCDVLVIKKKSTFNLSAKLLESGFAKRYSQ